LTISLIVTSPSGLEAAFFAIWIKHTKPYSVFVVNFIELIPLRECYG